jgi:hypothetical protein
VSSFRLESMRSTLRLKVSRKSRCACTCAGAHGTDLTLRTSHCARSLITC